MQIIALPKAQDAEQEAYKRHRNKNCRLHVSLMSRAGDNYLLDKLYTGNRKPIFYSAGASVAGASCAGVSCAGCSVAGASVAGAS